MTDREILSNAIDKAIANGFEFRFYDKDFILDNLEDDNLPIESCYIIIFSHSFAKAFWGKSPRWYYRWDEIDHQDNPTMNDGANGTQSNWRHHLQQIVLCENPIAYLGKYL